MRKAILAGLLVVVAGVMLLALVNRKTHKNAIEQEIWNQKMGEKYGTPDAETLRARLQIPVEQMNGRDADVCAAVGDFPDELDVWLRIQKIYPDDFRPNMALYQIYTTLGDAEHAVAALERMLAAKPARLMLAQEGRKICDFYHDHCTLLRKAGKHDESITVCRECIEEGCNACRSTLARTLLEDGRTDEALALADKAVSADRQDFHAYYVRGLVHWQRKENDQANDDWASTLKRNPGFTPAERMIEGLDHTLEEGLKWERAWVTAKSGNNLGWCGHYMRELELPEKAKRCDEWAEKLEVGSVDAQKLWHRAEYDLPGALSDAQALLENNPPRATLEAISDVYMRNGKQEEAAKLFRRLIDYDLRGEWAHGELKEACQELGDLKCAQHEDDILNGRTGH